MIELTLVTVGSLKEGYLREAVAEYEKRLSGLCRLQGISLKEEKISDEENPSAIAAALEREGERILSSIPEGAYTVAMCVEGKAMDSPSLARTLSEGAGRSGKLCFIIGSSHGLSPTVKKKADLRLSVSPLTFPHQLFQVL
jgi:23S rRNA (pseudouridine1915-N3)-methyltransferase